MFKHTVLAMAALGAVAITGGVPHAEAADLEMHVAMVNRSHATIFHVQTGDETHAAWGRDLLDVDVIFPGEIADVVVAVRDGACVTDMKMVIDDGSEFVSRKVDVCAVGRIDFTDETIALAAAHEPTQF
jgi:2-methylaconitate cis-trans-isomerase PrpF